MSSTFFVKGTALSSRVVLNGDYKAKKGSVVGFYESTSSMSITSLGRDGACYSASVSPALESPRSKWIDYLEDSQLDFDGQGALVSSLDFFVESIPRELLTNSTFVIFEKLKEKISMYMEESSCSGFDKRHMPSPVSMRQLFRYIPDIPAGLSEIYIDSDSGNFGVNVRGKVSTLNFVVKENKELIFSVFSKGLGVTKISGRAYFSKDKESYKINKLIGMIDDV